MVNSLEHFISESELEDERLRRLISLVLAVHQVQETLVKFHGAVLAVVLEFLVQRGHLHQPRHVAAGPDGDGDVRDLDVQNPERPPAPIPTLSTSSMSCQSFNVTTMSRRFSVRMLPMPKMDATLITPSPRTSMW